MSGICPHCKEEIKRLRQFQKQEVAYDIRLNHNGNTHYEKQDDYDGCDDWGFVECPECGREIKEITCDEDAKVFLTGEPRVR